MHINQSAPNSRQRVGVGRFDGAVVAVASVVFWVSFTSVVGVATGQPQISARAYAYAAIKPGTDSDPSDSGVTKAEGNYKIEANADALCNKDGATDTDFTSSPSRAKSLLSNTKPDMADANKWPGDGGMGGDDWATAIAKADMHAFSRSWGLAWLDASPVDENTFEAYAYAYATPGIDNLSVAWVDIFDPTVFEWSDSASHTFIGTIKIESGTSVGVVQHPVANTSGRITVQSMLDFGNDGSDDQLFYEINIAHVDGEPIVDIEMGPGVSLRGGKSEAEVESELFALWDDDNSFVLDSDYSVAFEYTASTGAAGSLAVSVDMHSYADASGMNVDLFADGVINNFDFAVLCRHWGDTTCEGPEWCDGADIDHSGNVAFIDLIILAPIFTLNLDAPVWHDCWDETQCHGDANNDGRVEYDDVEIFMFSLGAVLGEDGKWVRVYGPSPYDPCADFDRDGDVDYQDLEILLTYYRRLTIPRDCETKPK